MLFYVILVYVMLCYVTVRYVTLCYTITVTGCYGYDYDYGLLYDYSLFHLAYNKENNYLLLQT